MCVCVFDVADINLDVLALCTSAINNCTNNTLNKINKYSKLFPDQKSTGNLSLSIQTVPSNGGRTWYEEVLNESLRSKPGPNGHKRKDKPAEALCCIRLNVL